MPKIKPKVLSLDTEGMGLDLYHGARPFLVTFCNENNQNTYFEWPVDPQTRKVLAVEEDLDEVQRMLDEADILVLQNAKYDYMCLWLLFQDHGRELQWDWSKVQDTLLAGHLLASNQPHDLAAMVLIYCKIDIEPYEHRMMKAVQEAQSLAGKQFPEWRLAKKGLPEMPSVKEKVWKLDTWLPRLIAEKEGYLTGKCQVVNRHRDEPFDVYIGRGSQCGNPFRIGRDGTREAVIKKYRPWIQKQPWLEESLKELDGKRLGCWCKPLPCHGDVLAELLAERAHPWWTVTAEYANVDSASTLVLWKRQRELLEERGLLRLYTERLKVLPVVCKMESQGVTLNGKRLSELEKEFGEESKAAGDLCRGIATSYGYDLKLPKAGNNKSLTEFVFGSPCVHCDGTGYVPVSTARASCPKCFGSGTYGNLNLQSPKRSPKTGKPGMDKDVLEGWKATLPERSKPLTFVKALRGKRKRDTALSYMGSYRRFWLPLGPDDWYALYFSLNPTGTVTLRFSSQNPNEHNISKQEKFNLRHCFGPAPGREWWSLDAENIELRIPAYESGEQLMIDVFERPNDPPYYGSYHLLICHLLHPEKFEKCLKDGVSFKDRYEATWYSWTKNFNFADQYGAMEASGTADRAAHVPGAQKLVGGRLKEKSKLNRKWINFAQKHGYVETMPDKSVDPSRGYPLLCSRSRWGGIKPTIPLNYHVQGTAGWWMMKAMIRVQGYLDELNAALGSKGYYMILQVHDELVFDFPKVALVDRPRSVGKYYSRMPFPLPPPSTGNLPKIRKIQKLMEQGGEDIGVPTPVGIEYHPATWSEGMAV